MGGIGGFLLGGYRAYKAAHSPQVEYPSAGAQGKSVDVKKINDNYLKQNGLDAHEIKYEYLGDGAKVSNFDLYKTPSGQIVILGKGGTGTPIWTDYMINY